MLALGTQNVVAVWGRSHSVYGYVHGIRSDSERVRPGFRPQVPGRAGLNELPYAIGRVIFPWKNLAEKIFLFFYLEANTATVRAQTFLWAPYNLVVGLNHKVPMSINP